MSRSHQAPMWADVTARSMEAMTTKGTSMDNPASRTRSILNLLKVLLITTLTPSGTWMTLLEEVPRERRVTLTSPQSRTGRQAKGIKRGRHVRANERSHHAHRATQSSIIACSTPLTSTI